MSLQFATLRLGKTSVEEIKSLDSRSPGLIDSELIISVVCTQVPAELSKGTYAFIWLGSDNSKGMPTEWKQGFKALGVIQDINRGEKYNDESTTIVAIKYIFANAVNRLDILREAAGHYYWCSALPIIGLDDHSNQTIRMFTSEGDRCETNAFFCALDEVTKTFKNDISTCLPELLPYFKFMPTVKFESKNFAVDAATIIKEDFTQDELGKILADMYSQADNKTTAIHMFGLKYGEVIRKHGYTAVGLIAASGINSSYHVEVSKGVRIYESILQNEYGVRFCNSGNELPSNIANSFPALEKRKRTRFSLNCILYGAPGTGKTYATAQYALAIVENKELSSVSSELRSDIMARYKQYINAGQIVFTTFHQNYGYEDFIQGIRPDTTGKEMSFKTVDGVFKVIADRAMMAPEKDFVVIIDEINRANISKVFGELITLIEDDKRWGEENAISVKLPSGDFFAVPNNLYIVGTMNSADKSISLIDTALRRRFDFVEYIPNLKLISDPQLKAVLERLNSGIADELNSTDLLVGHSYFMGKTADDVCDIMNHSIIPLLYEYFFDNEKKVEAQIKKAVEGLDVEVKVSKAGRIKLVKKDVN